MRVNTRWLGLGALCAGAVLVLAICTQGRPQSSPPPAPAAPSPPRCVTDGRAPASADTDSGPDATAAPLPTKELPGDTARHHGATVSGRILSALGATIQGAEVSDRTIGVTPVPPQRSGPDGRYALHGLEPDKTHVLQVEAAGFGILNRTVPVTAQGIVNLDFVLHKEAILTGRVFDAAGHPMGGVHITMIPCGGESGWPYRPASPKTTIDGRFRIQGIAAGTYRFRLRRDGPSSIDQSPLGDPAVTLNAGQALEAITLAIPAKSSRVAGCVRDPEGWPLEGVEVSAPGAFTTTDSSGGFALEHLVTEVVRMRFKHAEHGQTRRNAPVGTTGLDIILPGFGSLSGAVYDAGTGKPLAFSAVLHAIRTDTGAVINDLPYTHRNYADARKGVFRFDKVPEGMAFFSVHAPGYVSEERTEAFVAANQTTEVEIALGPAAPSSAPGRTKHD